MKRHIFWLVLAIGCHSESPSCDVVVDHIVALAQKDIAAMPIEKREMAAEAFGAVKDSAVEVMAKTCREAGAAGKVDCVMKATTNAELDACHSPISKLF